MDKHANPNRKLNIKDIIDVTGGLDYINPKDIPSIDLYMDQLTTFMDEQLGKNKRSDEDKVLTKTMINNYTKNDLLPSPEKKKYSRQHLILLIYIYYLKNMLSINDIQTLLAPLIDEYFETGSDKKDISDIYTHLYEYLSHHYKDIIKDIMRTSNKADEMYDAATEPYLHDFGMISLLSIDIYVKKKYVEHLVDHIRQVNEEKKKADEERAKAAEARAKAAEARAKAKSEVKASAKSKSPANSSAKPRAKTSAKSSSVGSSGTKKS